MKKPEKKMIIFYKINFNSNNKEISTNNHNNKSFKYYEHIFKPIIINLHFIHQLKNGTINIITKKI